MISDRDPGVVAVVTGTTVDGVAGTVPVNGTPGVAGLVQPETRTTPVNKRIRKMIIFFIITGFQREAKYSLVTGDYTLSMNMKICRP